MGSLTGASFAGREVENTQEAHAAIEPDVLEITWFGIKKTQRRSMHYFQLLVAMQEYDLGEGLAGYTSIINTLRMPVRQGFGFDIEPLGPPQTIDGKTAIAVLFHVSGESVCGPQGGHVHSTVLGCPIAERRTA
jgi:acyl-homoserine lactone synthase